MICPHCKQEIEEERAVVNAVNIRGKKIYVEKIDKPPVQRVEYTQEYHSIRRNGKTIPFPILIVGDL